MNAIALPDPGALSGWNASLLLLLVKATLILLAALGITLAMQRASAGARHLVWLVTLGTLMLMPALTAWAPLQLRILPERSAVSAASNAAPPAAAAEPPTAERSSPAEMPAAPAPRADAGGLRAAMADVGLVLLLLTLWGAVALAILGSLAWSGLTVHRLVRDGRVLDDPSWRNPLLEVSDRLGLEEPPRLLQSDSAKMPFACGLLQPTIVLPSECESWSAERRLAVLLHELAHVRRHDLAGHALGRLVCAVYWFHPLAWTAARRLRSESERACDDLALACGTRATDYAEHLLDIVTSVRREGTPMVALAMARRKEFEGRMLAILDPEIPRVAPSRRQSVALIGALALISITVGAAAPVTKSSPRTAGARQEHAAAPILRAADPITAGAPADERATDSLELDVERGVATVLGTHSAAATRSAAPAPHVAVDAGPSVAPGLRESIRNLVAGKIAAGHAQGSDERTALLARVLRTDTSASLRRVAAWGLQDFAESPVAAEALAWAVRRDADADVREMAAWALADGSKSSAALDALQSALRSDASVDVRATAAWALGSIEDERSVPALVAALSDASPEVRRRAIWAIGSIEPSQAPKPLLAMLADRDPRVRRLTAWALFAIEDPEAAPALQAALRTEQDKELQIAYVRALASMGERSVEILRGLLESPDARIKSMAVLALAGGHASGPWPQPWPEPRPSP